MGVDYDANFGLGYIITGVSFDLTEEEEDDFDLRDFVEELITKDSLFNVITWGNEFSGNGKGMAVVLEEVPKLENLEEALASLKCFLNQHKITFDDESYLVGGVSVW